MGQVDGVFFHEAGKGTWGLFGGYPNGGDSEGCFIVVPIAKTASARSSQASLSGGPQGRVHLSDLQVFSSQQLPGGVYRYGRHDFRF